jgi:hypothetical protein
MLEGSKIPDADRLVGSRKEGWGKAFICGHQTHFVVLLRLPGHCFQSFCQGAVNFSKFRNSNHVKNLFEMV